MWSRIQAALLAACAAIVVPAPAGAWDYPGHRIVGAIADLVLQEHYPATHARVGELLELKHPGDLWQRRSLRDAAVFADCAKKGNEPYCGRPPSEEERKLCGAQSAPQQVSLHRCAVAAAEIHARPRRNGDTDVVQMIDLRSRSCAARRRRRKDVRLTDTEAVWLLAHLVGDIHQPLHVGAKYVDKTDCETSVDPNRDGRHPNSGSAIPSQRRWAAI